MNEVLKTEIQKIVLISASGYGSVDEAYEDRLVKEPVPETEYTPAVLLARDDFEAQLRR